MRKTILLSGIILFLAINFCFAEELTITTYYPSPYGSYRQLTVAESGAKTETDYGLYLTNTATSSTASINKYGIYVSSTGTWNGTAANNYGLYIDTPSGGTNNYGLIVAGGNVGLGTASPTSKLYIVQDQADMAANTPLVYLETNGTAAATKGSLLHLYTTRGTGTDDTDLFKVSNSGGSTFMTVRNSGNVGIGTTAAPAAKLDVAGTIQSQVDGHSAASTWPLDKLAVATWCLTKRGSDGYIKVIEVDAGTSCTDTCAADGTYTTCADALFFNNTGCLAYDYNCTSTSYHRYCCCRN